MNKPIKVMLVEDHELTRQGLSYGLGQMSGIEVVGVADNGEEAVSIADSSTPDVVLMDIVLPVLNGIKATKAIKDKHPDIKIIMLTSHNEQEKVFDAFTSGADGYCLKDIKTDRLVQVIEMVKDGAVWLDPSIAGFILQILPLMSDVVSKLDQKNKADNFDLTEREQEILAKVAEGLNNKEISDQLCISLYTVKNHVSNIIQKLSVEDRTQAAVLALKKGLI